jgi:small subunit ribosomal protein S20
VSLAGQINRLGRDQCDIQKGRAGFHADEAKIDLAAGNPDTSAPFRSRTQEEVPLANTAQAKKRARQAEVHRARNASALSAMRTTIRNVLKAVATKDKTAALNAYRTATSVIDRSVGKGIVHRNAAARYKSRLNQRVRATG